MILLITIIAGSVVISANLGVFVIGMLIARARR